MKGKYTKGKKILDIRFCCYIFHYKYPTMYYRQHNGVLQYQYSRNVSQNIDWRRESEQSSMERGLRRSFHRVKNDKKKYI